MNDTITVTRKDALTAGSCMGCSVHMDSSGVIPHEVWEVHLPRSSIRLCARCRLELIVDLVMASTKMERRQTVGVIESALKGGQQDTRPERWPWPGD